jgi:putrescine aminotransferase
VKNRATELTKDLINYDRDHILHSFCEVGRNRGIIFESAQGITLIDTEGKNYIDATSQLVCCNLGYRRPELLEAVREQLNQLQFLGNYYGYSSRPMVELSQKLGEIMPGTLNHFWFTPGGAESNDSAITLARFYWSTLGKPTKHKIISLDNAYHGSTIGARSAAGAPVTSMNYYGPPADGFFHIPQYYCYRCPFGLNYPDCNILCARFLEIAVKANGPDTIAAFIAEPMQGSAGIIVPPPEYWSIVREICTTYDVLLIADEVMTGFCRTGKMFCLDHWNITPDMMTLAKAITGAYLPLGVLAFSEKIWKQIEGQEFRPGYSSSGNPICCACATAAINVYVKEGLAENSQRVGRHILNRLENEFLPLPCVGTCSGLGLMIGLEIVADKATKAMFVPPLAPIKSLIGAALDNGLYIHEMGKNRIAICPPCVTTMQEADRILDILKRLVGEIMPPR